MRSVCRVVHAGYRCAGWLIITWLLCTLAQSQAVKQGGLAEQDSQTLTVSGNTLTFTDTLGTQTQQWELKLTGGPATVTLTISGCMRGGTCAQVGSSTATANSIVQTTGGPFDSYKITASWTGGVSPTLIANRTATVARSPPAFSFVADTANDLYSNNHYANGTNVDLCARIYATILIAKASSAECASGTCGAVIHAENDVQPNNRTCAQNPFPPETILSATDSGTVILPSGMITTRRPVVIQNNFIVRGANTRGVTGQYGTVLKMIGTNTDWCGGGSAHVGIYNAGTVAVAAAQPNSPSLVTITGTGTAWTQEMQGCQMIINGQGSAANEYGLVTTITDATHLQIFAAYNGSAYNAQTGNGALAYTINGACIVLGNGPHQPTFNTEVHYITCDGNATTGTDGILNLWCQELCAGDHLQLNNLRDVGFLQSGGANTQNSGVWSQFAIVMDVADTPGALCMSIRQGIPNNNTPGMRQYSSLDCNTSATANFAIDWECAWCTLGPGVHMEKCATCVAVSAPTGTLECPVGCAGIHGSSHGSVFEGIGCTTACTTVMTLYAGVAVQQSISINNIQCASGQCTNTLIDNANGFTLAQVNNSQVAHYFIDKSGTVAFADVNPVDLVSTVSFTNSMAQDCFNAVCGPVAKATGNLARGNPVKWDTGNANQVVTTVTTDTGAGIAVGVAGNATTAGQGVIVASVGKMAPAGVTGACAIGNFEIVDTTTIGNTKCTGAYTAGTVIGTAANAAGTNMVLGLR